eukprot:Trichotokara_eunicae@DN11158_c0_g1_i1.p1
MGCAERHCIDGDTRRVVCWYGPGGVDEPGTGAPGEDCIEQQTAYNVAADFPWVYPRFNQVDSMERHNYWRARYHAEPPFVEQIRDEWWTVIALETSLKHVGLFVCDHLAFSDPMGRTDRFGYAWIN